MRSAWAGFAARGNPSARGVRWPSFGHGARMLSLVPPRPHVFRSYAADHHCAFWAGG